MVLILRWSSLSRIFLRRCVVKRVRVFLTVGLVVIAVVSFPAFCRAAEIFTVHYATQTKPTAEASIRGEQAIKALIEQYRLGYQLADPNRLAAICADFTPALGTALSRYHQTAKNLAVEIEGVRILAIDSHQALATFIRQDNFIDARSGRPMRMKVELTKKFVQQDGLWKMLVAAE